MNATERTLLTVGHSNRSIETFLELLLSHRVAQVVDVRKLPGSRANPQFNDDALQAALAPHGIRYLWMPSLGGLRRGMPDSPNGGWRNKSFQAFADYMQTPEFAAAIDELLAEASERRTAIMCSEAVPWRCHRSLIADAALVRGMNVEHIMTPDRADRHKLHSFARVEGEQITYPPDEPPLLF